MSGVMLREPLLSTAVIGDGDEEAVADSLVRFAIEHRPPLAELASVDEITAMLGDRRAIPSSEPPSLLGDSGPPEPPPGYPELPDPLTELVPALLVGAGRYDEARRALEACAEPSWQRMAGANDRRLVRQLARWIEQDGKLPLPTTPARWPAQLPPAGGRFKRQPGYRKFMAEHRPEPRAQNDAMRAVRAVSKGKSREQIRELLRSELETREVDMQPVQFEMSVDILATESEPFGRARLAWRGLKALGGLIDRESPLRRISADGPPPEPEEAPDPAWARTPDRAAYPIWSVTRDRVLVQLDADAVRRLDELMLDRPGRFANRTVEVWLSRDETSQSSESALVVHIGSKRIGRIDGEGARTFRAPIEAAAERDEEARTDARLTRMDGTAAYVLDLPLHPSSEQVTAS
jgi:hypothetical protein